ncbi:MAG: hypothetical protein QOH51_950 [Acidobacteriota bacterium]|jgi:hypothetical protein|nr:hypothetical protein [Acidobacteriota bacterium]
MRYLLRAALRTLTDGVMQARPALPSRSPLAEADQRLNLDSFASQFASSSTRERNTQPLEEEGPDSQTFSDWQAMRSNDAGSQPSPTGEHEGKVRRITSRSETMQTETREKAERERPSHASTQSEAHAAPSRERPVHRVSDTSAASQKSSARPTRRANALPAPAFAEGHTPAPERARAEALRVAGREPSAAATEAASETLLSALSRAMSWVEGQSPRTREAVRSDERVPSPPAAPRSRSGETLPAWPGPATPRDRRPITHLEIGKIEVEVIPPAKPVQNTAPSRPAGPKTTGFSSALRQSFGWRQR